MHVVNLQERVHFGFCWGFFVCRVFFVWLVFLVILVGFF